MRLPGPAELVECYCHDDCFLSGDYEASCPYHSCGGMEAEAEIERLRAEVVRLTTENVLQAATINGLRLPRVGWFE